MTTELEDTLAAALRVLAKECGHVMDDTSNPYYLTRGPTAEQVRTALAAYAQAQLDQNPHAGSSSAV